MRRIERYHFVSKLMKEAKGMRDLKPEIIWLIIIIIYEGANIQ